MHVRSYVPALTARCSPAARSAKLLFDIRGFWADECVEGEIWRRGPLYRVAKFWERRFFAAADAVTLTLASVRQVRTWLGSREIPVEVIPAAGMPVALTPGVGISSASWRATTLES